MNIDSSAITSGEAAVREDTCPPNHKPLPFAPMTVPSVAQSRESPPGPGSLLKNTPGEGTGPTEHVGSRGISVGRAPSRGAQEVFQEAARDHLFYLYGLAPSRIMPDQRLPYPPDSTDLESEAQPAGPDLQLDGIDGHGPFLWRHREVAAVLSLVSTNEFCGPGAEANLRDLAWLGPRACRHQAVIERIMRCVPILPARFGALFSSLENLEGFLTKHHDAISRFLARVTDQQEWGVKAYLDRGRAEDQLWARGLARGEKQLSAAPGLRYMQEQKIKTDLQGELSRSLEEVCGEVANQLTLYAADFCERRVLAREVSGDDREPVVNWAFLVPLGVMAYFRARIAQANVQPSLPGLVFELSGPWPPYSFCPALDPEAEARAMS